MAVKINFDATHNVETPTMVLAKRSGDKLGALPAKNIVYKSTLTSGSEISFRVYKYEDGKENQIWDEVEDFKLLYCPEWNEWFEITVELEESDETIKNAQGKSLGVAELSQIMLYGIEINTDDDIESESFSKYGKTILYSSNPEISMLDRLLKDKASHYQIGHIDTTLITETERRLVQFEFNNKSLYDALQEIAEELNAVVYIDTSTVASSLSRLGEITRTINMYDLETNCLSCLHRGDFHDTCPKCGATGDYIKEPLSEWDAHGEDTTVFVSVDNLTDDINYSTDSDSVKNCFKLEAGDDTMTDIIRACNANGSGYIWYISDEMKGDMSDELVSALESYDTRYNMYQTTKEYTFDVTAYNTLINKYKSLDPTLSNITTPIISYPSLMTHYFNTLDFLMYLNHRLMPTVSQEDTTAQLELQKATNYLGSKGMSIHNYSQYTSDATIESNLKSVIGAIVSSNYKVSVSTQLSTFDSVTTTGTWVGSITLERYYEDEADPTATATGVSVSLNGNAELYYKQLINKKVDQLQTDNTYGATNLLSMETSTSDFANALKLYNLQSLTEFRTLCDAVLNILIEQGVADSSQWNDITGTANLYNNMYLPYRTKSGMIDTELSLRESEIATITALQDSMDTAREETMSALNFPKYLQTSPTGSQSIWVEFCSFRREDTYSNSNYISDGLDNAELFNQALRFLEIARKEIIKSATLQHSISSKLYNLLVMKEFAPLVDHFAIGNWIHIRVDEKYYKLRLVDYEIDFDDLEDISVTFSDVTTTADGYTDLESVINSAKSMATSYSTVQRQADKGEDSDLLINRWFDDGLAMSAIKLKSDSIDQAQSWDENGMLFRRMIPETGEYEDTQMRIINSTIAITTDNWATVRAAIGKFNYRDMLNNGAWKEGYGINGETIVGRLILGNELGIYNSGGSLSFNQSGLIITGNKNRVTFTPSSNDSVMTIKKMNGSTEGDTVLSFDGNGNMVLKGSFEAGSDSQTKINADGTLSFGGGKLTYNGTTLELNGKITSTSGEIGGFTINPIGLNKRVLVWHNSQHTVRHMYNFNLSQGDIQDESTWYDYNTGACNPMTNIARLKQQDGEWVFDDFTYSVSPRGLIETNMIYVTGKDLTDNDGHTRNSFIKGGLLVEGGLWVTQTNNSSSYIYFSNQNGAYIAFDGTNSPKNVYCGTNFGIVGRLAVGGGFSGSYGTTFNSTVKFEANWYSENGHIRCYYSDTRGEDVIGCPDADGTNVVSYASLGTNSSFFQRGVAIKWGTYSDKKGKDHIKNLSDEESLDEFFMGLTPVEYTLKSGHRTHMGFYAQDVSKVSQNTIGDMSLYEAVVLSDNGDELYYDPSIDDEKLAWSLNYNEFIAPTVAMLQKTIRKVKELEAEIKELKGD